MKNKKTRPILVECKEHECSIYTSKNGVLHVYERPHSFPELIDKHYNLILISLDPDEEIDIGDTVWLGKTIEKVVDITNRHENVVCETATYLKEDINKVIADKLSPKLIKRIVHEYNSNVIKDFEIEMKEVNNYSDVATECVHPFKRLHWVDSTVFCNECKTTLTTTSNPALYTEKDVSELMAYFTDDFLMKHDLYDKLKKTPALHSSAEYWLKNRKKLTHY